MELRLKLFGGLQLFWADEPITQKFSARARRLLSYLIVHRAVSLRRDSLAFTLWPDVGESDSLAMLRRALSELLAALPAEKGVPWLLVTGTEARWNPGAACQIDLADYERLVREDTPAAMKTAAALYNGDLLPEIDEEWASLERERLRQTQQELLSKLAMHHRTRGEWTAGLAAARRAVLMDPLTEGPQRDVMLLLYESGDRAAALAAYENLKNLLQEELGVAPMPETTALAESIAQGEILAHTGAQQETHPSHPSAASVTMIGRESETRFLWEGWQHAAQGHGAMILVGGEAGIGKTTLVRWLIDEITFRGGRALVGHCYPFEQSLPYQPLVEILRQAVEELRSLDLLPFYRALLGRLVPELGEGEQVDPVPGELRQQLYEAILNATMNLAQQKPLLLVIEDAHWMESSTLDWLAYAAPQLEKTRLYLVVTYRNTEVSPEHPLARLAGRFTREGLTDTITLSRLDFDAIRELVAQITGLSGETADQLAKCFYDESGGNPFYLKVLARGLVDSGQVEVVDGRWQGAFVEQAGKVSIDIPETVQSAIVDGVERLPEPAKAFVRMAAVAGRVFPYDIVQLAGGWPEEETLAGLEQALAHGFLTELPEKSSYAFGHHLVQESVYAMLSQPRRVAAHRRLAAAYLTIQPQNVTALAYHYDLAGEKDQARKYHQLAGERAEDMAAFEEAAQYYRAALAAWPESDRAGRADTYRRLGGCLKLCGQVRAEIDALTHATTDDQAVGNLLKAGETEGAIAQAYWDSGHFRQALEHARTAYEILQDFPYSRELCWVLIRTAEFIERADEGAGLDRSRQALALARHLEDDELIIEAQAVLGDSLFWRGSVDEGLNFILDSLRRAKELGKPYLICRMYHWVLDPYIELCRFHEYRLMAEEFFHVSSQAHYGFFRGYAQINLYGMDILNGYWKSAGLRMRDLLEQKKRGIFDNRISIFMDWKMGDAFVTFGNYEKALALLAPLEPLIREMDMKSYIAGHQSSLAAVHEGLGRIEERDQCCQEYLAFIHREKRLDGIISANLLDFIYFSPPQPEIARECLSIMESVAPPWANVMSELALAEARGVLLLRDGKPEEAVPFLRKALEGWCSYTERFPVLETRALYSLGRAFAACGERAQALEVWNQAWQIIEQLAAELDDQPEMQSTFLHRRDVEQFRVEREKLLE